MNLKVFASKLALLTFVCWLWCLTIKAYQSVSKTSLADQTEWVEQLHRRTFSYAKNKKVLAIVGDQTNIYKKYFMFELKGIMNEMKIIRVVSEFKEDLSSKWNNLSYMYTVQCATFTIKVYKASWRILPPLEVHCTIQYTSTELSSLRSDLIELENYILKIKKISICSHNPWFVLNEFHPI